LDVVSYLLLASQHVDVFLHVGLFSAKGLKTWLFEHDYIWEMPMRIKFTGGDINLRFDLIKYR